MNVAILGYDTEGRVSYDYYRKLGHDVTICDQKTDLAVPAGAATVLGESYLDDLDRFDILVRTAGMSPRKILSKNPAVASKITTQVNEFMHVSPTRNIIGVTGTKGKGTTSTLIAQMLEAAGKRVHLGGNIGIPALELLDEDIRPEDWVVLELSSFQLIDLKVSPHIGVCLMVVPEHLDWHPDINDYTLAKSNLFAHQKSTDIAIYFPESELSRLISSHGHGQKLPYFASPGAAVSGGEIAIENQPICRTDELKLLGQHNWQNVCAAVTAVWQATQDVAALRKALTTFTGLEHRLELVSEHHGVRYYNDSFGTTPETAMVALQAFNEPKVIILGGSDKGANYEELAKTVAKTNVRQALLIGEQAVRIQAALEAAGFHDFQPGGTTMNDIVEKAQAIAQPGDVVLLSPGCASFDMFENYKDRGNQFKRAVQALA
ncbi:MAG TPA: UDP-N-acetylmuramoyl-L-alanine--D-glutamate ligase [Candidatus Saccharimonadales bacterium]|nr:UDP-N-acetylmuramoyl-L-alanine--D-glutamate ligase [Candidatus Saccharimonadales bacterium]